MTVGPSPVTTTAPAGDAVTVTLSLVSHTNAGKTTLARTLLQRDVGEVRDAPHVTEFADGHERLRSPQGDVLMLWDTPGFGDSARLARRLQGRANPLGWFLAEVWDRWRDRPFWASQQALHHVKERADVVLYLVNASESPASAGYVGPEMQLLGWLDRPVLVLLNQLGPPQDAAAEAADVERWRQALQPWPLVRAVLPLDAFARCWVQEGVLWQAVHDVLAGPARQAMARLQRAWQAERQAVFDAAMQTLAHSLARLATLRVPTKPQPPEQALAAQLDDEVRRGTQRLLQLHGLSGQSTGLVLARVAGLVHTRHRADEGRAAWLGGLLSGALGGLAADVAAGGLTLGGGLIAGGVLGALGASGAARGLNLLRDTRQGWAAYADAALPALVQAALLRYLAVAHVGRGRGDWAEGEAPAHWQPAVDTVLNAQFDRYAAVWRQRRTSLDNGTDAQALAALLQPLLADSARQVLQGLYPAAARAAW